MRYSKRASTSVTGVELQRETGVLDLSYWLSQFFSAFGTIDHLNALVDCVLCTQAIKGFVVSLKQQQKH